MRTTVEEHATYAGLAAALVPIAQKTSEEDSDPADPAKHDAIYSALSPVPGSQQTLLMTSHFTTEPVRHPMLLFRPQSLVRLPVEWLVPLAVVRPPAVAAGLAPGLRPRQAVREPARRLHVLRRRQRPGQAHRPRAGLRRGDDPADVHRPERPGRGRAAGTRPATTSWSGSTTPPPPSASAAWRRRSPTSSSSLATGPSACRRPPTWPASR